MGRVQAAITFLSLVRAPALAVALTCLGTTSCVDVRGGAIELSWQIRDANGTVLDCKESGITAMRLLVRQAADGGTDTGVPDPIFACTRDVATTRFVYPAGSYDISLQPLCGDVNNPTVAKNYEVPAPIEREVRTGQLVELNALLVVIRDPSSLACPL